MHFNDIEMKIRSLYLTAIVAILAGIGWTIEGGWFVSIGKIQVSYFLGASLLGIFVAYLFYFMDRYWYHQLLKGAVNQAGAIEAEYSATIPALKLTSGISGASPIKGFRRTRFGRAMRILRIISPPAKNEKQTDLHSTGKIELFYKSAAALFLLIFLVSCVSGGIRFEGQSLVGAIIDALASLVSSGEDEPPSTRVIFNSLFEVRIHSVST